MKRLALLGLVFFACSPFELHEAVPGAKTPREAGYVMELAHFPTEGFARLRPGLYVLDDATDWPAIFHGVTRDFAMPHGPEVDWKATMGFAAVATDPNATAITIERVVKAPNDVIHVYVDEELRGDRCEPPVNKNVLRAEAHEPPIDVVTFPKKKLPIVVHVDRAKGSSCDPVPKVDMRCAIYGKGASEMSTSLSASPGDTIVCDGTNVTAKVGFVAERNWYFERKPKDSFAELLSEAPRVKANFTIDAYGEYRVRMEAIDDRHKSGDKTVEIDVAPPEGTSVVQLGWMLHDKFDASQLPGITPKLVEMGTGRECTEAKPQAPWCEVKSVGSTKQFLLHPQRGSRYLLRVTYDADREPQMPMLCARAFQKGATYAQETCDSKEHNAKDVWTPGIFNSQSGGFDKE
jgi:hypothetical protein